MQNEGVQLEDRINRERSAGKTPPLVSVMTVRKTKHWHDLVWKRRWMSGGRKTLIGGSKVQVRTLIFFADHPCCICGTIKLLHLSAIFDLGLDGLVRFAGLRFSLMDVLMVPRELVLASKTGLVVFAVKDRTFEDLGLDAMLG